MATVSLSAAEIADATGGRVVSGNAAQRIERWSIDTRSLQPGDLFVAIRGDRFDGHEFVAAALAAGAAGAVVTATPALPEAGKAGPAPLLIEVMDTTRALQDGAREVRRRSGAKVVAITGSAGKTTTKELTAAFSFVVSFASFVRLFFHSQTLLMCQHRFAREIFQRRAGRRSCAAIVHDQSHGKFWI